MRFRGEAAGRRFDDAVRTAKTMFALARHLGEHPTEAANRVGLSVAGLALDTLQEMLQQPGCPNLYLINGSSGHGVMHSPALGMLLAEIICDGSASTLDVSRLDPGRFDAGKPNPVSELL